MFHDIIYVDYRSDYLLIDFVVGESCVSDGMAFLFAFYISSVGVILLVAYILET